MLMAVLVIGGAGYVGSHMVKTLLKEGREVVVVDNLSTGFRDAVLGGVFYQGDFASEDLLRQVFSKGRVTSVMHFASYIQVGESVKFPAKYYINNLSNTLRLLNTMIEFGIKNFIFSSTAAVYGGASCDLITEEHPRQPINPYGRTKHAVEEALGDLRRAGCMNYFALRYFNAAGADSDGQIGERHEPETHLIPLVLQAASGRREAITIFGRDYPTADGTCVRDYVHVNDLCLAHLLALDAMERGHEGGAFNLGNSRGYSVSEVIETARAVTGKPIKVLYAHRRSGDPASLIADATLVRRELGWTPRRSSLETIVGDAWRWELKKGKCW
jgi:UDP-glucose 4-epimerase